MAFALAIRNTLTDARSIMLTSTSLIAIITVIVCGGCTSPMLAYLRVPVNVSDTEHEMLQLSGVKRSQSNATPTDLTSPNQEGVGPEGGASGGAFSGAFSSDRTNQTRSVYEKAWLVRKWYNFDVRFMKPLLTHSQPSLMDTLPECCLPLAS